MTEPGASDRIEQLIQALHDENEALREHAIASLGQTGPQALSRLIDLMAVDDAVIREAASSAVERMGDSQAVPGLIEALMDSTLREDAARVLKKIGDVRAVEALIDGLLGSN